MRFPAHPSWRSAILPLLAALPASADALPRTPGVEDDLSALMDLLNTPVVTASKVAQKASDAPATVQVVTAEQIRRRGYRSLRQVLQDLPDTKVEKRSDAEWYTDYSIRGVNGQDTFVILLDGMKINPSANERIPVMENYPVHMAKQIEVIYGPASALYGADAVSGVINIITKDLKAGSTFAAESTLGADGDKMRMANFHVSYELMPHVQMTVGGQWFYDPLPELDKTWTDYGGFARQRAGGPFASPFAGPLTPSTPFDKEPAYPEKTRALYLMLKIHDLDFRLFRNSAKVASGLGYNAESTILTEHEFLDQSVTALGMTYSKQVGLFSFQTNFTGSRYDLDPNSNFRNAFTNLEVGYKYAASSSFKAEQQVTWVPRKDWTLVGGVSYEVVDASPWSTDLEAPVDTSSAVSGYIRGLPLGKDGQPLKADFFPVKSSNTGAYLQGQFALSESMSLTLGARQDGNSRYGSTFNPRAGFVWHLDARNTFKVLYGSAFLAPSPLLAYGHFGSFFPVGGGNYASAFWRLPNPGLKPMQEKTLEASYQSVISSNFNVSVTVYRTKLTNLHQLVVNTPEVQRLYPGNLYKGWPVDAIEIRTNLGEQTNLGGTLKVDYLQSFGEGRKINAYVAYSHVDGKVDAAGDGQETKIGLVAPNTWRGGVELVWGQWNFSLRGMRVSRQRFGSFIGGGDPRTLAGYKTFDCHLAWDYSPQLSVYLDGSNILNARYRNINHEWDPANYAAFHTQYKGAPQDPRRLGLGVKLRF